MGRLTLLAPDIKIIHSQRNRAKISTHYFESNCNDEVTLWRKNRGVFFSVLLPQVAAAKALGQLDHLRYLLHMQTQATSLAFNGLLSDVDDIRHVTLQNQAAIDFLLFVQWAWL